MDIVFLGGYRSLERWRGGYYGGRARSKRPSPPAQAYIEAEIVDSWGKMPLLQAVMLTSFSTRHGMSSFRLQDSPPHTSPPCRDPIIP